MTAFTWIPTSEQLAHANVTRLAQALGCDQDFFALHRLSLHEPDRFWRAVLDDLGLPFFEQWHTVVDVSRGPEWATWFLGSRVNVAEACVHRWARERPADEGAVWRSEDGERRSLTFAQLSDETIRLAEALLDLGVEQGDTRRHLPADGTRGADRLARLLSHRRHAGADLLGLRRPRDLCTAWPMPARRS